MEHFLTFAKTLAHEAGEIALRYFGFETESTWKADNTPVTQADLEINRLVIDRIHTAFPDHSIKGEEESMMKEGSRYLWLCDPVDGTIPFSCGLAMFTFSIALVDREDGQPVLGLVNDPIGKNLYWATRGGGSFRNGVSIRVNNEAALKNTYLNVEGGGITAYSKTRLFEVLKKQNAKAFKLMSFIYGAIQVANGKFASSVFFGPDDYEVASLKILTEEAGGVATDLEGKSRRYDEDGLGFVISNGLVHQELLELIKQIKKV